MSPGIAYLSDPRFPSSKFYSTHICTGWVGLLLERDLGCLFKDPSLHLSLTFFLSTNHHRPPLPPIDSTAALSKMDQGDHDKVADDYYENPPFLPTIPPMRANTKIFYRCRNYITHVCPEVVWAAGHICKKCIVRQTIAKEAHPLTPHALPRPPHCLWDGT